MRRLIVSCAVFITIVLTLPVAATAEKPPVITANAAVLVDVASGQILYGKRETIRIHPASLTKIMTVILAIENGNLNDVVKVSDRAATYSRGSVIDLRKGDQLTLENLLKAAVIMSANDSTIAIAEYTAGDYDRFIEWMNLKAQLLGARSTRFANTHGFTHPNHYSTAFDLAVIARYALANPDFARLASTRETTVTWHNSDRKKDITNTNRLLRGGYEGCDGVKTGTTSAAGNCLIASASRDGRRLLAVVLHCGNRYSDAQKLLDYGFSIPATTACWKGGEVGSIKVEGGRGDRLSLVCDRTVVVHVPEGQERSLKTTLKVPDVVRAPVAKGQLLGELRVTLNGQHVGSTPVLAGVAVERRTWIDRIIPGGI